MKKNILPKLLAIFKIVKRNLKRLPAKNIFLVLLILAFLGILGIKKEEKQILPQAEISPIISADEFQLHIPKIKVKAPIIADVDGGDKDIYFQALENGVAHLKGTAKPGEGSNIFIYGHSSFYPWAAGDFKEVFRHLDDLDIGDEIIVWKSSKEFRYQVTEKRVVNPQAVEVARPTESEQVTLMTCVPPGTTLKRLIVIGKPE